MTNFHLVAAVAATAAILRRHLQRMDVALVVAAVAATAAILRRNGCSTVRDWLTGRSRRDCGNLEAVQIHFRHGFQCRAAVALFPARESEA